MTSPLQITDRVAPVSPQATWSDGVVTRDHRDGRFSVCAGDGRHIVVDGEAPIRAVRQIQNVTSRNLAEAVCLLAVRVLELAEDRTDETALEAVALAQQIELHVVQNTLAAMPRRGGRNP